MRFWGDILAVALGWRGCLVGFSMGQSLSLEESRGSRSCKVKSLGGAVKRRFLDLYFIRSAFPVGSGSAIPLRLAEPVFYNHEKSFLFWLIIAANSAWLILFTVY